MKPPRSVLPSELTLDVRPANAAGGEEVALRVSVIDGSDRMVYTDLRDRKGWVQPLAVNQALRDASSRHDVRETAADSQARVVRMLERFESGARGESRATPVTAYQMGKANARSRASIASVQRETKISQNLPNTNVPTTSRRPR